MDIAHRVARAVIAQIVYLGKAARRLGAVLPGRELCEARRFLRRNRLRENLKLSERRKLERKAENPQIIVHSPLFKRAHIRARVVRRELDLCGLGTREINSLPTGRISPAVKNHALKPERRRKAKLFRAAIRRQAGSASLHTDGMVRLQAQPQHRPKTAKKREPR